MRILLTGGGTAGHIHPAIAIAEILRANDPHSEIAFVGTPDGMENRLVGDCGYPMYHVRVCGFSRSLSLRNIKALYLALTSPHAAKRILREFAPDAVIGTGGYVSWPILAAAAKCGIPTALHESNALPGLTTRRLAPHMDAIWLNFRETAAALPHCKNPPVYTGNPLRSAFSTVSRASARRALHLNEQDLLLLSFGGSLGADAINRACLTADRFLFRKVPQLRHVHACGRSHYDSCRAFAPELQNPRLSLLPFIDQMPLYMSAADIIISRAGAMTISELALCGKCAVLIPSPHVADNHQFKNASVLADAGAAILLPESQLSPESLSEIILHLADSPQHRTALENTIRRFAKPDANRSVWQEIRKLVSTPSHPSPAKD